MKLPRRWQRIFILSLLALSVLAPLLLVSNRIKILTSDGRNEFVEDLDSIKSSTDALKLSSIEQEAEEGSREPLLGVYKDGEFNLVVNNISSNQVLGSEKSISAGGRVNLAGKNGTNEDKRDNQQSLSASEGKEQSNQTAVNRGEHGWHQSRRAADEMVMQMKDQLARAKVYLQFSPPKSTSRSVRELRQRIKEVEKALGEATRDSELSRSARQKMRAMESALAKASHRNTDCSAIVTKLQSMTYNSEERVRRQKNQVAHVVQLTAMTSPKGFHCLSMRLTAKYFSLEPKERELPNQHKFIDPDLHHFAVFSDNVLACAVVVKSTVSSTKEPGKAVFHVVTDSVNLPAISMWFLLNPPGESTVQILSMENFKNLSAHHKSKLKKESYRHPRHTSPLDLICFYLPDIFPALNKIVLLDHDVVVQRDLAGLWDVDMKGKVVGVVETCQEGESSIRQMDMFIYFLNLMVARKFDVNTCTWAFGMNVFDLQAWRRKNLTAAYHKYLHLLGLLKFERPLLKPGSSLLGWVTFYNQTVALHRRWHALGLGYDSSVEQGNIRSAAVIHYNGVMKPWLDIGIRKYKGYWSNFVNYNHPYLQQCNIHQ